MFDATVESTSSVKLYAGIIVAIAIYFIAFHLPFGEFSADGKHAFSVFCVAAFLWITNVFPLAITGIIVLFLLPISNSVTASDIYSYFGNAAIFFILGAFILASPVMRSGLSRRLAISMVSRFGSGPKRLVLSIFSLSSILAFFISEHAVAAMFLPIVLEIITATKVAKNSHFAFAAYMAMAWGGIIGGTATLLGGARAPLALAILHDSFASTPTTHTQISFLQWTAWAIPIVLTMLFFGLCAVLAIAHKSQANLSEARHTMLKHKKEIGKISRRELLTLILLIFTIVLWIFYGTNWGLDWIALLAVILAFSLRVTHWQEIEKDVPWGILIMYGSAIALSVSLQNTGAAHQIVLVIMNSGIHSPVLILILLIMLAALLTELMSNTAAVAVLLPIALALSVEYGIDPRVMTIALATTAGLTFVLPVSTPAMSLVMNSPYVNIHRAMLWGLWLKLISLIVIIAIILLFWPLVGIRLIV